MSFDASLALTPAAQPPLATRTGKGKGKEMPKMPKMPKFEWYTCRTQHSFSFVEVGVVEVLALFALGWQLTA